MTPIPPLHWPDASQRWPEPGSSEARIVDALLRCVARWGVAKTTVEDVAREAGCSRATVHRLFPGGRERLLVVARDREIGLVLRALEHAVAGASDLEGALVAAVTTLAGALDAHPALRYLHQHEAGLIGPYLSFGGFDAVLAFVADALAPHLGVFVGAEEAPFLGEWVGRLVASHYFSPGRLRLAEPGDARWLVRTHVLPGTGLAAERRALTA